jgi:hypothetical protein
MDARFEAIYNSTEFRKLFSEGVELYLKIQNPVIRELPKVTGPTVTIRRPHPFNGGGLSPS